MRIEFINSNVFAQLGTTIGVKVFVNELANTAWFIDPSGDYKPVTLDRLESPRIAELENELLTSVSLRHIAEENDAIIVHDQDRLGFLTYAQSYNL
tara:strand:+ start:1230 stop:1517 length:288 start_codon:yes stop_codon:yes gene_type:complete